MEQKFCQSCGMPLSDEILGTNADGSKNEEYCKWCYGNGAFLQDCSMEEMIDFCTKFVDQVNAVAGTSYSAEEYKQLLQEQFPTLKRWAK